MTLPRSPQPVVMVVSDNRADAAQVKSILEMEFDRVVSAVDEETMCADFDRMRPDVLVLAFAALEQSEAYYLNLFRHSTLANSRPHKTVVLCSKETVKRAYELCRRDVFDDYMLYWPHTFDAPRLAMCVHKALSELASGRNANPATNSPSIYPTDPPPFDADAESSAPAATIPESHVAAGQKPLVLVVDDEEFIRNLIGRMLTAAEYRVAYAGNGAEALNMVVRQRPDLVLMDVMMPGLDGVETTRRIRAQVETSRLPIIIMTGKTEKHLVIDCIKAGARGFVVKPFDRKTLLEKVKQSLADPG